MESTTERLKNLSNDVSNLESLYTIKRMIEQPLEKGEIRSVSVTCKVNGRVRNDDVLLTNESNYELMLWINREIDVRLKRLNSGATVVTALFTQGSDV